VTPPAFSSEVLAIAADILTRDDFTVRRHELRVDEDPGDANNRPRGPEPLEEVLLAEDAYFVVAATAAKSLARVRVIEPFLSAYLSERMAERPVGDKIWDGYVVLLIEERFVDLDGTTSVYDLLYDTSYVRRMVSLGVRPNKQSLKNALRPFLALPRVEVQEVLGDVLGDLADALATEGIERTQAAQAVETFRSRTSHV
jgi:hypothetical protein